MWAVIKISIKINEYISPAFLYPKNLKERDKKGVNITPPTKIGMLKEDDSLIVIP